LPRPRLIYFTTVDWYFVQHYLPLALAARDAGYDVAVMTTPLEHDEQIRSAGLRLIPIQVSRRGFNPIVEVGTLLRIARILKGERPDLLHNIAHKPVLYGTIAARITKVRTVYNALGGLGHIFTTTGPKARALRTMVLRSYRVLLSRPNVQVAVQNPDDADMLADLAGVQASVIGGAGVDLERFVPHSEPPPPVSVLLASRLLWDKGVAEYLQAAHILRERGVDARFALAGKPDNGNPASVTKAQVEQWQASGVVDWLGFREDMDQVLARCHIVCLPSYYGEGIPKILIEGLAAARPIITTDHPGCRETVVNGENGFLIPPRDPHALADALQVLIQDETMRRRFGKRSRALAEAEFGFQGVAEKVLHLYGELLQSNKR